MTLLASAGDLTEVEGRVLLRVALGPAGHDAWTGLATAALWWAHSQRWRPRGLAAVAGPFLAVVVPRTPWDATHVRFGYLLIGVFSVAALLGLFHCAVLR